MRFINRPLYHLLIVQIVLIASLNCSSLAKKMFNTPKVGVEKVELQDIDFTGAKLLITMVIDNPNGIGVTLNKLSYAVDVDGQQLLNGDKTDKLEVKGNQRNTITLPLTVLYSGLRSGIAGVLTKKELPYRFKGKIVLDTPLGEIPFDIDKEGKIPVPDRPRFNIDKVTLGDKSITSFTINFHCRITNNHDIGLNISDFRYKTIIHDHEISGAEMKVDQILSKDKSLTMEIPVNIKLLGIKRSVIDTIRTGKFYYKFYFNLNLSTTYGPYSLPYERESMVTLY